MMQNSQEINWWLEIARIGIPVIATLAVGYWISRSNERYKTNLAKEIHRYQTYHPKQSETLAEVFQKIRIAEAGIRLLLAEVTDAAFPMSHEDKAKHLVQLSDKVIASCAHADSYFAGARIFIQEEMCSQFDDLLFELSDTGKITAGLAMAEAGHFNFPPDDTVQMTKDATRKIDTVIPEAREKLEKAIRLTLST